MPKRIRNLWIAIGIWALVITSTLVFYFELWNALYFFTGYWIIGCEITGLIIAGVTLIVLIKERPRLPTILALISIVGLFFLLTDTPTGHPVNISASRDRTEGAKIEGRGSLYAQ